MRQSLECCPKILFVGACWPSDWGCRLVIYKSRVRTVLFMLYLFFGKKYTLVYTSILRGFKLDPIPSLRTTPAMALTYAAGVEHEAGDAHPLGTWFHALTWRLRCSLYRERSLVYLVVHLYTPNYLSSPSRINVFLLDSGRSMID